MKTAIAERGEHELVLAGVTYVLRPSHAAIRAIERKTERSLLELLRLGNGGALTSDMLGEIGAQLIRAGADPNDQGTQNVNPERVAELIYEEGTGKAMARLTLCLVDAATGGRTASGEAKAAAATTSGDAGAA